MLKTEELAKIYRSGRKSVEVFRGINLSVEKGECLNIRGPSGIGKSTLLNILGCLTKPSSGRVWIDEREISHLPEHFLVDIRRKYVGFIFQQFNLISRYTALRNVGLPLVPIGIAEKERNKRAMEILAKMNLQHRAHFVVNELSGGEQQRVAVARALINNPELVLADEPTSNIDAKNAGIVIDILESLKREGKTIIVASHDPLVLDRGMVDSSYDLTSEGLQKSGEN